MDALRKMYEALGLRGVVSYVQSGNVIFESDEKLPTTLETEIKEAVQHTFGFDVPVMVLTVAELRKLVHDNPFIERKELDPAFLHVTFLSSSPSMENAGLILEKREGQEEIVFGDRAIYLYCPHGYGTTKLNNNFLEAKLKVEATTRNWKTTNELIRLAELAGG